MSDKARGRNYKRFACQLIAVFILTGIDHVIKLFAERDLRPVGTRNLLPGVLGLRYVQNTGAALGFMADHTNLLSFITGAALLGIVAYLFFTKSNDRAYHILLPLTVAGGLGNLLDRLTRGYVVDYLEFLFVDFAVFNFADILITCGAFALVGYLLYISVRDQNRKRTPCHEPA